MADARIDHGVRHVHEEVDEDVAEGAHEDDALDERVVLVEDGGDGEAPHAPAREDGLDDDGAREQVAELHADDGDDGDEGVAEGVLEDDHRSASPLARAVPMYALPSTSRKLERTRRATTAA